MTLREEFYGIVRRRIDRWTQASDGVISPGRGVVVSEPSDAAIQIVRLPEEGDAPLVQVGRYSSLNWRARILVGGGHRTDWVSTFNMRYQLGMGPLAPGLPTTRGPVVIGNDVWIGYEALILSGVTIGDGAVVGARTVVAKDIEPYAIVVGNPQVHKGYRFDQSTREALLRIRWWEWPDEKVRAHVDALNSPELSRFVARHDPIGPLEGCPDCNSC